MALVRAARQEPGVDERVFEQLAVIAQLHVDLPLRLVELASSGHLFELGGQLAAALRPTVASAPLKPCAAIRSASPSRSSSARSMLRTYDGWSARNNATSPSAAGGRLPVCDSAACSSKTASGRRGSAASSRGLRLGRRVRVAKLLDGRNELVDVDRLRQVAVHARGETTLAIALHRMRGERDDRQRGRAGAVRDRGSPASPRSRSSRASARP